MLTTLKRNLGLLLAVATLSAVTALVPSTAGAVPSIVPNTGVGADVLLAPSPGPDPMNACPGTSAAAAGFTDTTDTSVDCLAMFNITTGKTATTYDPSGTISRQDMARFIHRMFVPTGMAAAGTTVVPAFTDTAHVTADGLAAISALASHGITLGTTATTYSPDDNVTREQMAMFLNRFASIAKDHAGAAIAAVAATTGNYNYTDITSATWEGMESIIRLYNLGVTDGACTSGVNTVTAGTCLTTYRPSDNITRLEMAGMVHRLLNLTNARPAGISAQSTTSTALVGDEIPLISVRNADFSAQANTLVDEFFQVHNDAAGVAAQAPFNALSGVCTANVADTPGATLCYVDSTDASTDVRGNITGTSQTTAAYTTANWWVHTGVPGTQYVDGTTSGHYKYSINHGAAAAATVYADKTTYTSDAGYATVTDGNALDNPNNVVTDGITTLAGTSRTFTATQVLTTALTSTVVDGYTFKVVTHKVDRDGNVANSTAYYPSSAGTASWTVTCSADDSATTTTWWETHELTVTMGAADGGTGIPGTGGNPLASTVYGTGVGGAQSKLGVTCLDDPRAYTEGSTAETLAISDNNYTISAAGSLASVTATAYDQYGTGVAGSTVRIQSNTDGAGATTRANLTTGANGTATLSAVVCPTGVETVAWSVSNGAAGSLDMDVIGVSAPGAGAVEGTTMYCSTVLTADSTIAATAAVQESFTITLDADGGTDLGGTFKLTYGGVKSGAINFNGNAAHINGVLDAVSSIDTDLINCTDLIIKVNSSNVGDAGTYSTTCTFNANAGPVGAVTCQNETLSGTGTETCVIAYTQATGVFPIEKVFVDDNPATNTVVFKVTTHSIVGVLMTATDAYQSYTYDSTDQFTIGAGALSTAANGATMAQFAAALLAETGTTVNVTGSDRKGALTTGVSHWQLG